MQDIADAIANGSCVLFAGSGTSRDAGLPDWIGLAEQLRDYFEQNGKLDKPISDAVSKSLLVDKNPGTALKYLEAAISRPDLVSQVVQILRTDSQSEVSEILAALGFAGTVTTNFDKVVNGTVGSKRYYLDNSLARLKTSPTTLAGPEQFLFKIHGDVEDTLGPEDDIVINGASFMIVSDSDFTILQGLRRDQLTLALYTILQQHSILFLGYSFADPDIKKILDFFDRNCVFPNKSWYVTRKGSSVPTLPNNVTPIHAFDDWSDLPAWLLELNEVVEEKRRNLPDVVRAKVPGNRLVSDQDHKTLQALVVYLNDLKSEDLAERVLAASLVEDISQMSDLDLSWIENKVGELLSVGPTWANALALATSAFLIRVGIIENTGKSTFRVNKASIGSLINRSQSEWEKDRNDFLQG